MPIRRRSAMRMQGWATGLGLLALVLQILTPPGMMVARRDDRATMVICTGHGPAFALGDLLGHPAKPTKSRPDAPCAFAGHGAAAPDPATALISGAVAHLAP